MVSSDIKRLSEIILVLTAIAVIAAFAVALPTGPDSITVESNSRHSPSASGTSTQAQAGNLTELSLVGESVTKAWQGYFGNVSGNITLEDASGNVFYNWIANEPQGEIYASNSSSISWTNVNCFIFVNGTGINLSTEEAKYGMAGNDVDGIDETFNTTTHPQFFVGDSEITSNSCPATTVYASSVYQNTDWFNVLLMDPDGQSIIFTTIIENRDPANDTDKIAYNGATYDFQLLVAEDGHNSSSQPSSTVYFWIEIE